MSKYGYTIVYIVPVHLKKTYQVYLIHLHIQIKDHFIYKLQGFLLVKAYMFSIDEL